MLNRVWNLGPRNEFAEKLCKKTGGAFLNFPRFASAHCMSLHKTDEFQFSELVLAYSIFCLKLYQDEKH